MAIKRYSKLLLVIAIVLALFFIYSAREELLAAIRTASLKFAVFTFVATLAYNSVVWYIFHRSLGAGRAYLQTSRMFYGAQVAKYVPGKVWGIVYQATLKSTSMPVGNIIQANIVVLALTVTSAVFASAALIVFPYSLRLALVVLVSGAVAFVYLFSSDHLYRILQRLSRVSQRFELTSKVPIVRLSLGTRIVIYGLLVFLYVLSNILMLYIFFDFALDEALQLTAYLGIAWIAGVVIAVTPSGLGVREVVFVSLGSLAGSGNFELYASVAIAARAVQVLQDLALAFLVPAAVRLFQDEDETGAEETQ